MILPDDQDTITAMVGKHAVDAPPAGFVDAYTECLAMMSRAGKPGPLGAVVLISLLREFKFEVQKKPATQTVGDWQQIAIDTVVQADGRRALFKGKSGDGMLLVRFDGYRALNEIPERMVLLVGSKIEGIADEAFTSREVPPAAALLEPAPDNYTEGPDTVLASWGSVSSGTRVYCRAGDEFLEGEFVDIGDDADVLTVMIDGRRQVLDANDVSLELPAVVET